MLDRAAWRAGVLRLTDASRFFAAGPVNVLRFARLAARTRFAVDPETVRAARAAVPGPVSPRLLREGLTALLTGRDPAAGLQFCRECGLLARFLPEVDALHGVEQPPQFHPEGDVWTHTLLLLEHLFAPDAVLAWSALLHDIGKPVTQSRDADGRIRFFNHEHVGAAMADKLCARLGFPAEVRERIVRAVAGHMRLCNTRAMRPATVERLLETPDFPLALELMRLDCMACHGLLTDYLFLLDAWAEKAARPVLPAPLLRGDDLLALGLKPSPRFGAILRQVYEKQRSGGLSDRAAALEYVKKLLETGSN